MTLTINGEEKTIAHDTITVLELLKEEQVKSPDMVSVELNGSILDRDAFQSTIVRDGDAIEFLYFMGGGHH